MISWWCCRMLNCTFRDIQSFRERWSVLKVGLMKNFQNCDWCLLFSDLWEIYRFCFHICIFFPHIWNRSPQMDFCGMDFWVLIWKKLQSSCVTNGITRHLDVIKTIYNAGRIIENVDLCRSIVIIWLVKNLHAICMFG